MSKSLGNIVTIRDALSRYAGPVVRLALLSSHYRQPLDWTESLLQQSQCIFERFQNVLRTSVPQPCSAVPDEVMTALQDDLNTPRVFALMHEYANAFFKTNDIKYANALKATLDFLGFDQVDHKKSLLSDEEIQEWIQKREDAKKNKNYTEADCIRAWLKDQGVILEDTKQGVRIKS